MDQSISHGWRRRITIALANPPIDLPGRQSPRGESEAEVAAVERKSRRVWRAISWVLVANMMLFWLLTCVAAFAQSPPWAGVHLIYTPSAASYTYALAVPNSPGVRDEGIKFRVQTSDQPIEGQPVVALQRLTLLPQGRVWLSADANEVASLRAQGWQLDGTLGFIAPQRTSDTVPLYRFTQEAFQLSLYTTKSPDKNWLKELFGWRDAEIVGYVKAATDRQTDLISKWIDSRPVEPGLPTITSFAPATGQVGAIIQIGGSHFTDNSSVRFNGVAAVTISKLSAVALQVTVPTGATTGKITVTTAKGSATSASVFTVTPPPPTDLPSVAGFAPQNGLVGSVVTITGTSLTGATSVKFNGVSSATVTNVSATTLQASVPTGASNGKISVTTSKGTAISSTSFTVTPTPPPKVLSFAPQVGQSGSVITISGTNLAGTTSVKFNGVSSSTVTNITETSLQAGVPATAGSGKISVTTSIGTGTSTTDFTVTVPPPLVDAAQKDVLRFLTQATFGPKPASVERVKAIGIAAWIDEQFTKPAESHMSYIDAAKARRVNATGKSYYAEEDSYEAIWQQWLFGSDELRARMSFALSELMVISNVAPDLEADAMSSYMDTLNQHAFGNYRDLLGAVTLHPAMGYYLNMLGSEKEDATGNKHPNENYAREVLQLFSVGLVMLNPDGTRKVDSAGVPIPSYDENVVKGFARAFTGWTFAGNDPANPKKFDRPEENWTKPMIAFASKHETGTKSLLSGVTLPAGQTAEKDMKDALDNIFNHPNVGPFVGRQLILRFVTSNPSPAYIARVAAVFDNNGRGIRGDLGAVIKAVLTDNDARSVALSGDAKFGKQREPVIRFANILRAFNAIAANGRNNIHYLDSADDALGQSPLLSPSVFNFFSPFYTRPGRLAQSGMIGPEFQITNEIQTVGTANFFYQLVKNESFGYGDSKLRLDLTQAKSLANNPAQLVDHLSGLLTYGDLSMTSRQIIVDAVTAVPFNNRDSDRNWRVRTALTLFALSSDFVIQK